MWLDFPSKLIRKKDDPPAAKWQFTTVIGTHRAGLRRPCVPDRREKSMLREIATATGMQAAAAVQPERLARIGCEDRLATQAPDRRAVEKHAKALRIAVGKLTQRLRRHGCRTHHKPVVNPVEHRRR